ncbi:phosphoglycerol transferase [Kaistia soli DSM 19436]|uniref:Phosphoglycerol transferase n=1 Tax=Kaistia soli DSM 19436 TaxID=1122133 RepID=A0A1M4ZMJ4_9HYPH|nr:glycosyltransferase [Kaistia soli]SHF19263.1 phosphoglycerol transferase [Kaistia soli DSM 19436]
MHIALVNAFPTMASTAEVEYIKRFKRVAEARGHHAYEVVTSDDIHCCAPDFVIATHEFTPKLTPFFTVGALWSPPAFYAGDPLRIRSILSHDAYLVGSPHVGQFLDDLEFSTGTQKPRSDFLFLPTAPATDFVPRPDGHAYELVYVGVHWDGKRHSGLLEQLHASGDIALYGPAGNWRGYEGSFRGEVPYDGISMQAALARHGIALCVHKDDHRAADTPSMRLFEAAAAGCLIITDEIPFAGRVLGDSVFRLDLTQAPEINAARVREIIAFANADPAAAGAMARRSHDILKRDFSLEDAVDRCCDFVTEAKEHLRKTYRSGAEFAAASSGAPDAPLVDIIIRTGGRTLDFVKRSLRSIADQSVGRYRVILADYNGRDDVAALATSERTERLSIDYLRCANTGLRSSTLWAGLRQVTAPYFAMLDDDDTVMPDHFGHLLATARDHPGHPLYYGGVVRVEEDPIEFMSQPNFTGPMDIEVPELRELKFMDGFDLIRLVNFDNYIQSNAWIARASCLDDRTLVDPALTVAEDMYLYLMLARFGAFRLSPSPTALWNWRSASTGNSMDAVDLSVWQHSLDRLSIRLNQEVMGDGFRFSTSRSIATLAPAIADQASRPPRLPIDAFTPLRGLVINERRANLNPHEDGGVWTAATESEIELLLSERVSEANVELAFTVAGATGRPQSIDIQINGEPVFRGPARTWQQQHLSRLVHFKSETARLKLRLRCAYTISPAEQGKGGDTRQIGIFLSGILVSRPKRDAVAASESQAA